MRWKLKAAIQNALALLPEQIGNRAYYLLQKRAGGLRRFNPLRPLRNGVKTAERIRAVGRNIEHSAFLEVGTGWDLFVSISYWLMGAERVFTIDVNRHVQPDLMRQGLRYLREHRAEAEAVFGGGGPGCAVSRRLDALLKLNLRRLSDVTELCNITYLAPANAGKTQLPDRSVDFHTSCTVLEHITPDDLRSIFIEGRRVTRDDGLFIHAVDYTDHFSHSDNSISAINFLRYSETEWTKYGNTRFMYSNRLRHDDFLTLFRTLGFEIIAEEPDVQSAITRAVAAGFPVHPAFLGKQLAVTGAWFTLT